MHEKQNAALLEKECGVVNQKKKERFTVEENLGISAG